MIEAAIAAGADTAYLSGSGPTVAAITSGAAGDIFLQRTKERVDKQVWQRKGLRGVRARIRAIFKIDYHGQDRRLFTSIPLGT